MQMGAPIETPGEPLRARLWRRAVVLTGVYEGGTRVLSAILREEPTLERMSETRLEQRVIQLARQWRREEPSLTMGEAEYAFVKGSLTGEFAERLDGVSAGLREAWLLCVGFGLEPASVALMLHESTTAVEARLTEVEEELSADGASVSDELVRALRERLRSVSLGGAHEKALQVAEGAGRGRRRRASFLWVAALVLVTVGLVLILRDLMGWDESQSAREQFIREQSNLLPSGEEGVQETSSANSDER